MNHKSSFEIYYNLGYNNGLSGNAITPDNAIAQFQIPAEKLQKAKSSYIDGFALGHKVSACLFLYNSYNNGTSLLKVRKNEKTLLRIYPIDSNFIIGVFQGGLSTYDIVVKYWKLDSVKNNWGLPKQPKHIHWVVDMMIKQEFNPKLIKSFIDSMKADWDNNVIEHIDNPQKLDAFLEPTRFYTHLYTELKKYYTTSTRGEYPLAFLIALSELLMTQERTNLSTAFMFRKLLDKLENQDFFGTISTATHNGR